MPSNYRKQLESYLRTLHIKADAVLDIGGAQKPIRERLASWEVQDYAILDLEQPHEGEKPNIPMDLNDELVVLDVINAREAGRSSDRGYDIVFCMEVMEYIINPRLVLGFIALNMRTGGKLYISFPFLYPVHNPTESDFMRYTKNGARELLKRSGFIIEKEIDRKAENPKYLETFYSAEGMRAAKFYDHDIMGTIFECTKI